VYAAGISNRISAGRKYLISIFLINGFVPKHNIKYIDKKNSILIIENLCTPFLKISINPIIPITMSKLLK
jgi:hypothetical protein